MINPETKERLEPNNQLSKIERLKIVNAYTLLRRRKIKVMHSRDILNDVKNSLTLKIDVLKCQAKRWLGALDVALQSTTRVEVDTEQ